MDNELDMAGVGDDGLEEDLEKIPGEEDDEEEVEDELEM